MNIAIFNKKLIGNLAWLVIVISLLGYSAASIANESEIYFVQNINVGAESDSPAQSRGKAFSKARRKALERLLTRINIDFDVKNIESRDIEDMVIQERVVEETISENSYFAVLDIRFSKDYVESYISEHNRVVKNENKTKKLQFLLIPVLMDGNKAVVWDDENLWKTSIVDIIDQQSIENFQVIRGDIFNISIINSQNVVSIDKKQVREFFDKYGVDFVYAAFYSYNKKNLKAKLTIKGFTLQDKFQYRLGFNNTNRYNEDKVKSEVASKLIQYLSSNSLDRAEESDDGIVRIEIPVRRLTQWLAIKNRLQKSDFVTQFDVKSISKDFVKVDVVCKDAINIVQNFAKMGFNLTYRSQDVYLLTAR